jgi:hypothetical protein
MGGPAGVLSAIERALDERIRFTIGNAGSIGAFAQELIDYVDGVVKAQRPFTERFSFGPLAIELSIVGDVFRRRMTTAIGFARLPGAEHSGTAWRIAGIDGVAAGVGPPPQTKLTTREAEQAQRILPHAERKLMVRYDPNALTWRLLSLHKRLGSIWTADAARIPDWEDAAPFRDLFHWMTLPTDYFLAHAAAIGIGKAGVLLIGPGGSGKSTTAAAAALRGLRIAGDDFILVDPQPAQAYALYDCIKLSIDSVERFPQLRAEIVNPVHGPVEKGRIHLYRNRPLAFARSLPITAAILPRVTGQSMTTIAPATASDGVRALVPSTIFLVDGGEAETMRKASSFLRKLPLYHCNLGTDPFEAMDTISAFIGDLVR